MKNIAWCLIGLALLTAGVVAGCQSTQMVATSAPAASEPATMYGTGSIRTKKILYIVDGSGSMVDNFEAMRDEVLRAVGNLPPTQRFGVILITYGDALVVAGEKESLVPATPENKKALKRAINADRSGAGADMLLAYEKAFKTAFAMKPEIIYFVTDQYIEPNVLGTIADLNADKKVKLSTVAYLNRDPALQEELRTMARDNGGKYKFVSEKALGH